MFTLSYSLTYLATARLALMSTQRFKTTINCANCVRAITPVLNAEPAITAWQVDTTNPDKLLTVTSELPAAQVVALVEEAGFEAQAVA
jgi:copper chaperone